MSSPTSPDPDEDPDFYDSDTPLPFPKPLDRTKFLEPDFSAAAFLSTLQNRFQTLEDLQTELQDLLRNLNKELVDLVNNNYTDFLSLGEKLRGGEERIEEVSVGLLGFQRDVTGVKGLVAERADGIRALLGEKRELRRDIRTGRTLLDVDERLQQLELRLNIARPVPEHAHTDRDKGEDEEDGQIGDFKDWDESWTQDAALDDLDSMPSDEEADLDSDLGAAQTQLDIPQRLKRNLEQLHIIQQLARRCAGEDGKQHPFVSAQRDRISQIKDILKRDLEAAIRAQGDVKVKQRIIRLRGELDEEQ